MSLFKSFALLFALVSMTSCRLEEGAVEKEVIEGGNVERSLLTYMDLMFGFEFTSPLSEDALALPEDAPHREPPPDSPRA